MKHVLTVKREYIPCCEERFCRCPSYDNKTKITITCTARGCSFEEIRTLGGNTEFPRDQLVVMNLDHRISVLESMHAGRAGGLTRGTNG